MISNVVYNNIDLKNKRIIELNESCERGLLPKNDQCQNQCE